MCDDAEGYYERYTPMKVVMHAGDIPDGATITKRTGQKEYTLKDKIVVYTDKESTAAAITLQTPGVKYLTGDSSINAVSSDVELVWHTDLTALHRYLGDILDRLDSN